jgi:hypothetical protein
MLMKLTAGVNFINILRTNFSYECLFSCYILALLKNSYEKCSRKTLMKLTTGTFRLGDNGKPTFLFQCLYFMSPLNHKKTTSSLAPPIFYVTKNLAIKKIEGFPFHQHYSFTKILQNQSVITDMMRKTLLYEKVAHKMLVKLTPAINFINVFTYEFFIRTSFRQLFLVTFGLCCLNLYEKCTCKCW